MRLINMLKVAITVSWVSYVFFPIYGVARAPRINTDRRLRPVRMLFYTNISQTYLALWEVVSYHTFKQLCIAVGSVTYLKLI